MTTPQKNKKKFFGPDYPDQDIQDNQDSLCWALADINHKLMLK